MENIKRKKNLAITFLICMAMLFAMISLAGQKVYAVEVIAGGECGENLTWTYDSDKVLTISGTGDMYDYEYDYLDNPTFKGPPWAEFFDEMEKIVVEEGVTGIGSNAFVTMFKPAGKVSEAVLPSTLLKIGDNAFSECGTDDSVAEFKVTLPERLTAMGELAFASANIKTIKIPDGIKRLNRTFDGCIYLENIDLGKVEELGGFTFAHCKALKDLKLPNTLKKIEECVFYGEIGISEIIIPEGVTSLGRYDEESGNGMPAFMQCDNLKKVVIPSTVTQMVEMEFGMCEHLQEIDYQGSQEQWAELTKDLDTENFPANIEIKYDFDYDLLGIKNVEIKVDAPKCGTRVEIVRNDQGEETGQTNAPEITIDKNAKYQIAKDLAAVGLSGEWVNYVEQLEGLFEGTIVGGNSYVMLTVLEAKAGYTFATEGLDVRVNGKAPLIFGGDKDWLYIVGETTAVHNWDAGKVTRKATTTAAGVKTFTCTGCKATRTEAIAKLTKMANPLKVKGKTVKVSQKKLRKKTQNIKRTKVLTVSKAQGKMTYKITSAKKGKKSYKKYIKINSKTGKVTIKKNKKMKKGTYKVKVKVKAAGNANYNASPWKTVTFKIRVR